MRPTLSAVSAAATILIAACVSTRFPDGTFACDVATAPACPPGLTCATDGRCRSSADGGVDGNTAITDAAGADAIGAEASDGDGGILLLGDSNTGGTPQSVDPGTAMGFPFVAVASGSIAKLHVLLADSNRATSLQVGIYQDYFDSPGHRLASGQLANAVAGWNAIPMSSAALTQGTKYWITLMSTTPNTPLAFYEDALSPIVIGNFDTHNDLTELPTPGWSSGATFKDPPICAYVTSR